MFNHFYYFTITALILTCSCQNKHSSEQFTADSQPAMEEKSFPATGSIEVLDGTLSDAINPDAKIEVIAEGFDWCEGPLWLPQEQALLFSDIPPNKIYQWSETAGLQLYLKPSGYTGERKRDGEVGSNGLLLDPAGRLVLCQHGDRRMARMDAPLGNPKPQFITLADEYEGKRLNSPNDAVFRSNGDLYFTDPPYGLEKNMADPAKELPFQGVYRVAKDGKVHLLTKELSRPNGIAFSPDEKVLYVANSDPKRPIWMAFDVQENGGISNGRVLFDAAALVGKEKGLPDGLKVSRDGILFASGPGGILIINENGKHLGTIKTGQATSNCAFNEDESILYITADMFLMRVKIK
jgi:gluconolactonase